MSDLPALSEQVYAVSESMTAEQILQVRERLLFAKSAIRELEKSLNDSLLEWMRANGDLNISPEKRLYIGKTKTVKCNSPAETLEALLQETGGDFGAVTDCLSSGAFKHGACRRPLGDKWEEHFTETIADKVSVKEADAKFAKRLRKD